MEKLIKVNSYLIDVELFLVFVSCLVEKITCSFYGLGKIDLVDLAYNLLIFENQISSLSSNTLIGVSS